MSSIDLNQSLPSIHSPIKLLDSTSITTASFYDSHQTPSNNSNPGGNDKSVAIPSSSLPHLAPPTAQEVSNVPGMTSTGFVRTQPQRPKVVRLGFVKWDPQEDTLLLHVANINRLHNVGLPSSKDSRPDKKGDRYNWKMIRIEMHARVKLIAGAKLEQRTDSAYRARVKNLLAPPPVYTEPVIPNPDDMLPTRVSGRERKAARVNEIHHLPVKGGSKYVRITDRPDYVGPPYLRDSDSENSEDSATWIVEQEEDGSLSEDGDHGNDKLARGDSAYDKVPRKKRSRPLPHAGPSEAMTAAKELRLAQERAARPPSVMPTAPENESAEAKRDRVNARRRERHQELKDAAAVNSALARQHAILLAQQKAEKDLEDAMSAEIEFDEYGDEIRGGKARSGNANSSGTNWSPEEDELLLELKSRFGGKASWGDVLKDFTFDRSMGSIQSRWNNILKTKIDGAPPGLSASAAAHAASRAAFAAAKLARAQVKAQSKSRESPYKDSDQDSSTRSESPVPKRTRYDEGSNTAARPGYYYEDEDTPLHYDQRQDSVEDYPLPPRESPPPVYPVSRTFYPDRPVRPVYVIRTDQFGNIVESNRPIEYNHPTTKIKSRQQAGRAFRKTSRQLHLNGTFNSTTDSSSETAMGTINERPQQAQEGDEKSELAWYDKPLKLTRYFRAASI